MTIILFPSTTQARNPQSFKLCHEPFLFYVLQSSADRTNRAASTRGTISSSIQHHSQMQPTPVFFRENFFKVFFDTFDRISRAKFPPSGETEDMSINRKRRNMEGLIHHDRSSFMANTRQRFQSFEITRNPALILIDQYTAQGNNRGSLSF